MATLHEHDGAVLRSYAPLLLTFILNLVNIKKTTVATLVAKLGEVDKTSRRKNLTADELVALQADAIRAVRSALTVLRKLK